MSKIIQAQSLLSHLNSALTDRNMTLSIVFAPIMLTFIVMPFIKHCTILSSTVSTFDIVCATTIPVMLIIIGAVALNLLRGGVAAPSRIVSQTVLRHLDLISTALLAGNKPEYTNLLSKLISTKESSELRLSRRELKSMIKALNAHIVLLTKESQDNLAALSQKAKINMSY